MKKSGTAVKKTVLPSKPHPTKPGVKVTLVRPAANPSDKTAVKIAIKKPVIKTAIPLVKVVSKKPLSPAASKSASTKAAKKTLKKAASSIALKKGTSFTSKAKKNVQDVVQKQIEDIAKKTQPSIFPDVPSTPGAGPAPTPSNTSENLPSTTTQDAGMSQGKMLAIAGGLGLLAFVVMGKKGR